MANCSIFMGYVTVHNQMRPLNINHAHSDINKKVFCISSYHENSVCVASKSMGYKFNHSPFIQRCRNGPHVHCKLGWRNFRVCIHRQVRLRSLLLCAASVDVAAAVDVINDLGFDTLTFLAVTVLVVPAFRTIRASPILGFFFAGVVLNQFGLIRNLTDVKILSEWGILFLLFEMGLELSLGRLKALAKFAFGMGLTQVVLSTLAFTAFELPPNGAIGTKILEFLFHSRPDLVNIRSVDEAVVIGAALSLSSSAFVLQAYAYLMSIIDQLPKQSLI